MMPTDFAKGFHELWERALKLHFQGREFLERIPPRDGYRRLALEIVLHDLELIAARAAALATFAGAPSRGRKRP